MPTASYNHVISEIKEMSVLEQLRLLEDMAVLIRQKAITDQPRSILELQGKGKQIWKGVDAQKYINEERLSWNG
jgi:hypothetical protein